jgi:hypothetical protein
LGSDDGRRRVEQSIAVGVIPSGDSRMVPFRLVPAAVTAAAATVASAPGERDVAAFVAVASTTELPASDTRQA